MWIWIANKSAKFHAKRLIRNENITKCFRGIIFWNTLYIVQHMFSVFKMKLELLELRISRSLLQGHWCRNILFRAFNNLKQKVCFNFSSVFELLSILFIFLSLWVRGNDCRQRNWNRQWRRTTALLSVVEIRYDTIRYTVYLTCSKKFSLPHGINKK